MCLLFKVFSVLYYVCVTVQCIEFWGLGAACGTLNIASKASVSWVATGTQINSIVAKDYPCSCYTDNCVFSVE